MTVKPGMGGISFTARTTRQIFGVGAQAEKRAAGTPTMRR
jgi:hypothetical protein